MARAMAMALLAWPRAWVLRNMQIALPPGAAEWLRTAIVLGPQSTASTRLGCK